MSKHFKNHYSQPSGGAGSLLAPFGQCLSVFCASVTCTAIWLEFALSPNLFRTHASLLTNSTACNFVQDAFEEVLCVGGVVAQPGGSWTAGKAIVVQVARLRIEAVCLAIGATLVEVYVREYVRRSEKLG